jgi:hypothetical protein
VFQSQCGINIGHWQGESLTLLGKTCNNNNNNNNNKQLMTCYCVRRSHYKPCVSLSRLHTSGTRNSTHAGMSMAPIWMWRQQ